MNPFLFILLLASLTAAARGTDFHRDIQPLLETRCISCHGSTKQKGNLDLSTLEAAIKGGDSGPGITPGNPAEGELLTRISLAHDDDDIMPPKGAPVSIE